MSASVFPYLLVSDAPAALELYAKVFGMKELYRIPWNDKVGHAELEHAGSRIFLASAFPEMNLNGPAAGQTAVSLVLIFDDVDAVFARASEAGFEVERAPKDEPHGSRVAVVRCPFGHRWMLEQILEKLSDEEIQKRYGAG